MANENETLADFTFNTPAWVEGGDVIRNKDNGNVYLRIGNDNHTIITFLDTEELLDTLVSILGQVQRSR